MRRKFIEVCNRYINPNQIVWVDLFEPMSRGWFDGKEIVNYPCTFHLQDGTEFNAGLDKRQYDNLKKAIGIYQAPEKNQADEKRLADVLKLLDDEAIPQVEVAKRLGVTKSAISRKKAVAIKRGYLTKDRRLTQDGHLFVAQVQSDQTPTTRR